MPCFGRGLPVLLPRRSISSSLPFPLPLRTPQKSTYLRRQIIGTGTTGTRQYVVSSNSMNDGYLESCTTRRGGKVIQKETWYAIEGVTLTERGLPITTVPMSSKAASTDDSSMNSTWHWPKNRPVFSSSAKHMLLISPHFPKMSRIASCRYIGRAICALLHVTRAVILKEFTMIFFNVFCEKLHAR